MPCGQLLLISSINVLCNIRKGPNKWRDRLLPVQILDEWVKSKNYPMAEWGSDRRSVTIDGEQYTLDQFGESHGTCPYNQLKSTLSAHVVVIVVVVVVVVVVMVQ